MNKNIEKDIIKQDEEREIEKMYHLKTNIMPVIVGAQGMIKKRADKFITKICLRVSAKMKYKNALFSSP